MRVSARFLCLLLSFCFLLYTDDLFALTARDVRPILHRWTGLSPGPQSVVSWKGRFGAVLSRVVAVVYHADGQGSTRHLTDFAANVTDTYTFDAFGVTLASTGSTPNNYQYTGEQLDPNLGFYYLRARYLNQTIGRFTSTDPFAGFNQDPKSLHKYAYASLDPANNIDPSGLFTLNELIVVGATIGILAAHLLYHAKIREGGEDFSPGEYILWLLGGALIGAAVAAVFWYAVFVPLGLATITTASGSVAVSLSQRWTSVPNLVGHYNTHGSQFSKLLQRPVSLNEFAGLAVRVQDQARGVALSTDSTLFVRFQYLAPGITHNQAKFAVLLENLQGKIVSFGVRNFEGVRTLIEGPTH